MELGMESKELEWVPVFWTSFINLEGFEDTLWTNV